MAEHTLDCKGMKCPMPIVSTFKKFSSLAMGDTLKIISDDMAFPHDIKAWCNRTGQSFENLKQKGNISEATIKKIKA